MKAYNILKRKFENFAVFVLTLFFSFFAFAQDATKPTDLNVDVTTTKSTTTTTEEWFTNPVYWVIGALLFIILIAVIMRGNSKRD